MKIRGQVFSATQGFEFKNLKKFGSSRNVRAASETEEYRNIPQLYRHMRPCYGGSLIYLIPIIKRSFIPYT